MSPDQQAIVASLQAIKAEIALPNHKRHYPNYDVDAWVARVYGWEVRDFRQGRRMRRPGRHYWESFWSILCGCSSADLSTLLRFVPPGFQWDVHFGMDKCFWVGINPVYSNSSFSDRCVSSNLCKAFFQEALDCHIKYFDKLPPDDDRDYGWHRPVNAVSAP